MNKYFRISIIQEYISSKNFLFVLILLSQLLIYYFLKNLNWLGTPNLEVRDAYSFYVYDFSNIKNFLSQYRSFGGPLFVYIYKLFSADLANWGTVNYTIYCFSLVILYFALCSYKFSQIYSFFFVIGILGSTEIWYHFGYWSESISLSFLILSVSLFFFSSTYNKLYLYLLFSFFLFISYQTRPLLVIFVIFFVMFEFIILKFNKSKKIFSIQGLKTISFTLTPLIIFLLIRFFITGHLGIAPYVGAHLSSHTIFHLEDFHINKFSPENKVFAENISIRIKKHKFPCNLSFEQLKDQKLKNQNYHKCYTYNTMSVLLEMIDQQKNLKPFEENDPRNFNSWEHLVTLDKFFMSVGNHNEIDQKLKSFAYEFISIDSKGYFEQFKINLLKGYKDIFKINLKLIYLYFLSFVLFFLIFTFSKNKPKDSQNIIKIHALIIAVVLTNFLSYFFLSAIHLPKERLLAIQGIFLIPSIGSYLIYLVTTKNILGFKKPSNG
tara:strand:- start:2023 stop:3501 length:1479 start_codon:yes stop_codon:yes gene_type:complete